MPVFISYRHTDRDHAKKINDRLKLAGIGTYFDVQDIESRTTEDIASVITRNINECTHLIAVVSQQTALSWWVPFEIGEATITDRRICSFKTGASELPQYLDKWPKMTRFDDIDLFIDEYRKESSSTRSMTLGSVSDSIRRSYKANAERFHSELKNRIRRGF